MWPFALSSSLAKSCTRTACQLVRLVCSKNIMTSSILTSSLGPRVGNLQIGDLPYPTPNFFIHTQSGSIPHLTPEVFQMSFDPAGTDDHRFSPIQISMESTYTFHDNVHPSGLNISQFVGLPKCPSFLTVHDPLTKHVLGYNAKAGVSIWPRTGRVTLDTKKFFEIVSNFKPDMIQCLSDFDVDKLTSLKRLKKSTARTIEYLQDVLDKSVDMNVRIVGTIEAGWFLVDKEEGNRTIAAMLERTDRLAGFLINGVEKLDRVEMNIPVLSEILSKIPKENLENQIIIPGVFQLDQILELVLQGVDLFDSSVITKMTEEGKAFGFPLNEFLNTENSPVAKALNEDLPISSSTNICETAIGEGEAQSEVIISLKDKRFFDDCRPILAECDCYTCRRHTRSYIHHLFSTGELLGLVLLMSHNLFHFDRFFTAIRLCLGDVEKLNLLKERVAAQNYINDDTEVPIPHIKSGLKRKSTNTGLQQD